MKQFTLALALLTLATCSAVADPLTHPTSEPTTASAPASAAKPTDPAKKALIDEMLKVMRTEEQSDALAKAILSQSPAIVEQVFPQDPNLTPAHQAEAQKQADRAVDRFQELFKQNVDIPAIVRQVTYDLYDKYFTADEIKDLIAFYKTPTGQKAVNILPQLSQESMKLTDDALAPRIKAIVQQLQDEEAQREKSGADPAKYSDLKSREPFASASELCG